MKQPSVTPAQTEQGPNPSGLCVCGCGQRVTMAAATNRKTGLVKGSPVRYVKGHAAKGRPAPNIHNYKIMPETGCWEWQGRLDRLGYARVVHKGRLCMVHRLQYEIHVGAIPDGLTLDHLCKNRRCCNPAHMEPVTLRENILRGDGPPAQNARRTHCHKGHPLVPGNLYTYGVGRGTCRTCCIQRATERNRRLAYARVLGVTVEELCDEAA